MSSFGVTNTPFELQIDKTSSLEILFIKSFPISPTHNNRWLINKYTLSVCHNGIKANGSLGVPTGFECSWLCKCCWVQSSAPNGQTIIIDCHQSITNINFLNWKPAQSFSKSLSSGCWHTNYNQELKVASMFRVTRVPLRYAFWSGNCAWINCGTLQEFPRVCSGPGGQNNSMLVTPMDERTWMSSFKLPSANTPTLTKRTPMSSMPLTKFCN